MSGFAGLSPSRKRKPEGSTSSGYVRNLRKECADLVAGQAVLTAEVTDGKSGGDPSHDTFGSMRLVANLWNGLRLAAFAVIAIAILAGGCHRPRSKNDGDTTAISAGSQLSQTLVGKRITIRGGLFRFKCGPGIQFDDGAVVCLVDIPPKSGLDDPYAQMYEKLIEATGTLRFYHDSTPLDETRPTQRQRDHYYLEKETTQLRIISNYAVNSAESAAKSQFSVLVGKRITIRGKLLRFGFPVCLGILLDDEEAVCLEDKRPKPISNPYPGMFEKRVEAAGTLRFFHDPTVMDENIPTPRVPDHYYFETETTQVRLIPN
jgi:hypothetical protein